MVSKSKHPSGRDAAGAKSPDGLQRMVGAAASPVISTARVAIDDIFAELASKRPTARTVSVAAVLAKNESKRVRSSLSVNGSSIAPPSITTLRSTKAARGSPIVEAPAQGVTDGGRRYVAPDTTVLSPLDTDDIFAPCRRHKKLHKRSRSGIVDSQRVKSGRADDCDRVISADELHLMTRAGDKKAGTTALCPFDCDCCF